MNIILHKNDKKFRKSLISYYKRENYFSKFNYQIPIYLKTLFLIIFFYIGLRGKLIHKIHISIGVDNKYVYAGLVYLTSLLDNRAESTFYIIHVLSNDKFSQDNINKIKTVVEKYSKNFSEVIFYNLGDDFKGATIGTFALSTYYRIALPSLLPNLDKIIYTDTDMINLKDLTEMYNIKFEDNMYLSGTLDKIKLFKEINAFGIKIDKYINAGVLLMNLKVMRENSIEKKLRDFVSTHTLRTVDQTAINAVCHNNIQVMPYKYAVFAFNSFSQLLSYNNMQDNKYKFNESELYEAYHNPTLLHFFGGYKPWKKNYLSPFKVYWWYYAKMSGFFNEILNYYNTDINYVENLLKKIPDDGGLLKRNYKKVF
jgi:lipopolysaccharide biosynthesis glycosyltransferase